MYPSVWKIHSVEPFTLLIFCKLSIGQTVGFWTELWITLCIGVGKTDVKISVNKS